MSLKLVDRMPLSKLQIIQQMPSPLKRKVKISTRRLPQDFFPTRKSQIDPRRNEIQTQSFPRKGPHHPRLSQTREASVRVGPLSSRLKDDQETMKLIEDVISSSREIKKMIRKHSLQMKKENRQLDSYRIELPPLMLKKEATMAF